jgi:aspartate carbamoyltransferase catalytic subunit
MPQTFDDFRARLRDDERRRELLWSDGRPRYVLQSQLFSRADLDHLFGVADAIEALDATAEGSTFLRGTLSRRRVVNLFAQPSTRTCESFVAAAERLGASARVLSDVEATSLAKGESVEDTLRTLSCFYDALVVRHPDESFAARAAWASSTFERPIPVISAGSGKAEHPTQALLDLYTLHHAWKGQLDGKRLLLVGDIGRNRAARSLALLLPRFEGVRLDVACHPQHQPEPEFIASLRRGGIEPVFHSSIDEAVSESVDAIYVTRLQQEWDDGSAPLGTADAFVLRPELRARLRPDCLILHPLPRVNELPDAWTDHPGFLIWRQVRNGMWVRSALMAWVFGADDAILARAAR